MSELKLPTGEVVCDYCGITYPDELSLKVHEMIHAEYDIDSYLTRTGISNQSDYLPKAKQLLPQGIRNYRFIGINHRRIISRCGKHYSKVFDVSEAIGEVLEMCKKYPIPKSADKACEKLNETSIAEKVPIYLTSPSTCSSYSEASPVSSPSCELGSGDSDSDQNKAQNKGIPEDEQNNEVSPDPIVSKESVSDKGYCSSTPEEQFSKNTAEIVNSNLEIGIINLMDNLVSEVAAVSDDLSKLSSAPDKLKPNMERSVPDECALQQNKKFDFKTSDKPVVEAFESVDEISMTDNDQFQSVPDFQGSDIVNSEAFVPFDKNMIIDKNVHIPNVPDLHTSDKHDFEVFGIDDENMTTKAENQEIETVSGVVYSMPIIC